MPDSNYELTYLISSELSNQEAEEITKEIKELANKAGEILSLKKMNKIKLAYPIKKKSVAFLTSLEFKTEREKIAVLKKELNENKNILRYLLIKKKEVKAKGEEVKNKEVSILAKIPSKIKEMVKSESEKSEEKKRIEMKEVEEKIEKLTQRDL